MLSYFSQRSAKIECLHAPGEAINFQVSGGVPQGSVIGPLLWNLTYNSVLTSDLLVGTQTMGFADDTLIVVKGKNIREVEDRASEAIEIVLCEIERLELQVAPDKTEAVLFTNKYKYETPYIEINGTQIKFKDEMTYLGVIIDKSRLFKSHITKAVEKAERVCSRLSRIMPNIGGPKEKRRRLMVSVFHSVLMYGAPSWGHTMCLSPINTNLLNRAQRRILLAESVPTGRYPKLLPTS